jgi:hypothetical protein
MINLDHLLRLDSLGFVELGLNPMLIQNPFVSINQLVLQKVFFMVSSLGFPPSMRPCKDKLKKKVV